MATSGNRLFPTRANDVADERDGRTILADSRSAELFLAVVGPVGAGASRARQALERTCAEAGYEIEAIKVSDVIRRWATEMGIAAPSPRDRQTLDTVRRMQDLGDQMRAGDPTLVARATLAEIAKRRARRTGRPYRPGEAVGPGGAKVAYLIDSIRHPAETNLFRRTYSRAFALVGVVCEHDERRRRILNKYFTGPESRDPAVIKSAETFMLRDADDETARHGQHVTDAFHEADFFVDNSRPDDGDDGQFLDDPLGRLVSIISHAKMIRPTIAETAMHHAHSARVRSACLSRQVGAALVDADGTVVATGTNEVPRAGGGVYGEGGAGTEANDHRCAFREEKYCSNTREQNKIINELIDTLAPTTDARTRETLHGTLRATAVGRLIEFSRAVHAEMDALLSAAREGVSTVGTRLFVTTFPCHYCARHIVSAGVYEVQYIEPYPKSLALDLHRDAIAVDPKTWHPPEEISMAEAERRHAAASEKGREAKEDVPGQVLFTPFVGVAPRLYLQAFEKTRSLKDKTTGDMRIQDPEWGDEWRPFTQGYPELEAKLGLSL